MARDEEPTQQAAAAPQQQAQVSSLAMVGIASLYILVSTGLIAFNKWLMTENRFPFAIPLVMSHMCFCFLCCSALLAMKPALFSSLETENKNKATVVWTKFKESWWFLLPISLFFTGTLVLSNQAYLYCSLAFLQMMKEGNLLLVYVASLLLGLETVHRNISQRQKLVPVLLFILFSTCMTVYGEIKFVLLGFMIQLTSQFCEVGKIVLQNQLLSAKKAEGGEEGKEAPKRNVGEYGSLEEGKAKEKDEASSEAKPKSLKMDPLTFVLLISPFCFCWLSVKFVCVHLSSAHYGDGAHSFQAVLAKFLVYKHILLLNCCVAFVLNVVIAYFMKLSTALTFIIAGIVKDIFIVVMGVIGFQEHISNLQIFAFVLQCLGIFVYSLMKAFPLFFTHDEKGIFESLWDLKKDLCGEKKAVAEDETANLVERGEKFDSRLLEEKLGGGGGKKFSHLPLSSSSAKSTDGGDTASDNHGTRTPSVAGSSTEHTLSESDEQSVSSRGGARSAKSRRSGRGAN